MARELDNEEREAIARADLQQEINKWNNLRIRPDQAIGIDIMMFNSRFHALLSMLEEANLIDRDELEIRALEHLLNIFKQRREEIEPEIHAARQEELNAPKMFMPRNGGKMH